MFFVAKKETPNHGEPDRPSFTARPVWRNYMKIALLGNQARAMSNFWTVLLRRLTAAGHEVICLVPRPPVQAGTAGLTGKTTGEAEDPAWEEALTGLGARIVHYSLDRKGLNPIRDLRTLLDLRAIFKQERPDLLFAYTIKPVIYGALASALAKTPSRERRNLMITGLGYMFEGDSPTKRVLMQFARLLYRLAFAQAATVFFQNDEDRGLFEKLSILPPGLRICMSKGTGVDTERFAPAPLPSGPPVMLFIGRLLEAKGLRELHKAARLVKERHPQARFLILGPAEHGPGSVPLNEVLDWQKEGIVEYLGETRDVRPYLRQAHIVLLPSWREGTPCSLLEGMSMGRAVIAANAPGSREVVLPGKNGLLTPVGDAEALAKAVESLIIDPALTERMGNAGRALAQDMFSAEVVARDLMREMGISENPKNRHGLRQ